ncbi:MAG: hypothetical protein EAZ55_08045 [Cytophagales bacterium]|nr:MAG: hypothetical protein EAZ55_08045 [Cytophagales bacterium]
MTPKEPKYQDILGLISQQIHLAIYIYNLPTKNVEYSSLKTKDFLGYDSNDLVKKPGFILSIIHPEDLPIILNNFENLAKDQTSKMYCFRYRLRKRNQEYVWLQNQEFVMTRNSKGEPENILGVSIDISEDMKRIERVKEQKQQLDEIAWIISHELRPPVANILGLVAMLEDEEVKLGNRKILDLLKQVTEKLDKITYQIVAQTHK